MPSRTEFQILSERRIKEAKALQLADCYEGAFYLAGYAMEFALKAAVCKRLDLDNVFDSNAEVYKGFKTHRLDHLILISELTKVLADAAATDIDLQVASNPFVVELDRNKIATWDVWSEVQRYNATNCQSSAVSANFINHVETFVTWLKNHW